MKITGAIFDADGTLFDSMFVWEGLSERYLISKGVNPDKETIEKVNGMYLRQAVLYMSEKFGFDNNTAYNDVLNCLENQYRKAKPKDGVPEFLSYLKSAGVKMCIATSSDKTLIEKVLKDNSLNDYFDFIITSNDVQSSKENPEIYNLALLKLGTDKSTTYVFEDTTFAAQTAKKAGFNVCGVFDAHEIKQNLLIENSDIYIKSFCELL